MSTETLHLLRSVYNEDCTRCELHEKARSVCVRGRGKFAEKVLFIAEAPGEQEDRKGLTLIGKAGEIFDRCLGSIGMTEEDFYATNIVKCRPPGNRTPTPHEVSRCAMYLWKEIKILDPKIIVLMGASAIKSFFGRQATVKAYRGRITDWNGYDVFCTLHPSSVNYEPYNERLILDDLNILVRHLNGSHKPSEVHYIYSETNKNYRGRINLLSDPILANDIETTGLDMYDPSFRIISNAFSGQPNSGTAFLLNHKKAKTDWQEVLEAEDEAIFSKSKIILVGHNFKFDLLGYRAVGLEPRCKVRDTMVMAHLLDENLPDKSLEALCIRDTDMGAYKSNVRAERDTGELESLSVDELLHYNCQDGDGTIRLHNKYLPLLKEQGMIPLLDFQMEELKMLVDIEWTGWMIDVDAYYELKADYKKKIRKKRDEIWEYSGEINLRSSQQKAKFLYEELGFKILEMTKGGVKGNKQPSTSKKVLKKLLWTAKGERKTILEAIIEYSTLVKRATFFPQVKENLKADGKIHCSYKQTKNQWGNEEDEETGGTVTGRLSAKNPNVQQIPREGDIKRLFVSQWEGGRIVQLDYSQMELRVLAEISRDRRMHRIFAEGDVDIHRRVASWVFRKAEKEITDKQRKFVKRVNFGIAYMIGPQGLSNSLSEEAGHVVSEDEARDLIDRWFGEFPQVKSFISETKKELIRYGEVQTPFGRKRRLADTNPGSAKGREGIRQGVNFLIQSLASDITLYRAVQFWKWLRKEELSSRIVGLVHDSVVVDCPKKEVMKVAKAMKRIFEDNDFTEPFGFKMTVPLKIDIHQGESWGDKNEIKS